LPAELEQLASSPALQLAVDSWSDRIEHVDIQVLSGPVTDLVYKVAFTDSVVRVAGLQPVVVQPSGLAARRAVRRPLRRRQLILGIASALVFLLGLVIFGSYSDRHNWYQSSQNATTLAMLSMVLPLATLPLFMILLLPKPGSRRGLLLGLMAPPLAILATMVVLAATGDPSIAHARSVWKQGDSIAAKRELRAAIDLGIEPGRAKVFHDQITLTELRKLKSATTLLSRADKELHLPKNRAAAKELAYKLALAAAWQKRRRGDFGGGPV
jgi:hypothetical protein